MTRANAPPAKPLVTRIGWPTTAGTVVLDHASVVQPAVAALNVGTVDQRTYHPKRFDVGGWATWATTATPLILTASSRGAQGTAMHLVGVHNYARFDVTVPGAIFTLDRASPEALAGLAAGQSRVLSPTYTEMFADHVAHPYTPIHGPGSRPATPTPPGGDS